MYANSLATKLKLYKTYNRVLVAKSYDSLSFNYRGIGRWQIRYTVRETSLLTELYLNGTALEVWTYSKAKPINIKELTHALDLIIDNTYELYKRATPTD